jgi:coenzyme F420 hydrogenase subunit beta
VRAPGSVREAVESGLCIGCGLCAALGPFEMLYTPEGRLRPRRAGPGGEGAIMRACPGALAAPNREPGPHQDPIWGSYHRIKRAWAGDPEVRFRAATGGVLTTLGMFLLQCGKARFILHCAADPDRPMRSRWFLSETPEEVLARAGSRYGPSDTLAGLEVALSREEPFAIIAKPCDAGAVRARNRRPAHRPVSRRIAGHGLWRGVGSRQVPGIAPRLRLLRGRSDPVSIPRLWQPRPYTGRDPQR